MAHWNGVKVVQRRRGSAAAYRELKRVPDLSLGVYVLPAGGVDEQLPHTEDEVYVVLSGRGRFRQGRSDHAVGPGSILFVPAKVRHSFHDVRSTLTLAVIFGPAEYSRERQARKSR
jgi:mannose-6-phosphate isomerase-like protein (cupin superfamily)